MSKNSLKSYTINLGIGLNMFFADIRTFHVPVNEKPKYVNVYSKRKR